MSVFYSSVRFLLCWSLFSATETICFCPDSFILLSEWFDLLLPLPLCLSAGTLVVNVAQTFYQAEENHHITLEWTFTPKTLSSSNIYIFCQLITDQKVSVLFQLHEGVEVSESQDEQFSGRVQFDKDVLREGRLRLDVSRLRTEDSGLYLCEVNTESGSSSDKCRLNVTVRKDQDNRTNTTTIEPEKPGAEKMDVGAIVGGVHGALIGLGLILIGVLVKLGIIKNRCGTDQQVAADRSQTEELNPAGNGLINVVSEV
ncbi:uncharacterized protein LOC108874186 isoform X6 [Lates calcarifer]|uniref:Uncharacterized protein LOC108874186 isoform X6 n=1 Tax=Lates calcarifer TaxID=8187 RepID=A0AAJ8B1U8_LATCA|nr:uncharacterized protein LOC108874186 isoform X6 [Lates calcarifer]